MHLKGSFCHVCIFNLEAHTPLWVYALGHTGQRSGWGSSTGFMSILGSVMCLGPVRNLLFANTKHVTCRTVAVRTQRCVFPNVMHICCIFFNLSWGPCRDKSSVQTSLPDFFHVSSSPGASSGTFLLIICVWKLLPPCWACTASYHQLADNLELIGVFLCSLDLSPRSPFWVLRQRCWHPSTPKEWVGN